MYGYDFERSAQRLLKGIREERRWRGHSNNGFLPRTRRFIAVILEFIIAFFTRLKCWVDSWRAGPEYVDEHTLKESFLTIKMNAIEKSVGNPHNINFERVLMDALFHDLPEGDPRWFDMNHYVKKKDKKKQAGYKHKEKEILYQQMVDLFGEKIANNLWAYLQLTEVEEVYRKATGLLMHSYFMLEGVRLGRIAKSRRERWLRNVRYDLIEWLKLYAWKFESVRRIVEGELIPKWRSLQTGLHIEEEKSSKRAETQNRR